MSAFYLTTPIYYANDLPHIGHAYATVAADAIARYRRLRGDDVFFLTGTDEHGVNIERIAVERGLPPDDYVDAVAARFKDLWSTLDITYDRFIRTTESAHHDAVLALWHRLSASGDLYRGTYTGPYCSRCEAYFQEDELLEGNCPVHGFACEIVREDNWFFRLSRYQEPLERLVRDTDFVQPEARRNEVLGLLRQGLKDFSASRRKVSWGIPVPGSADETIYVWVDALANYLTGVGFPDQEPFERYWPADLHLIGKEIIRFHCLYWPALLLSAGLPLPRRVFAHGWLTKDGHKVSKSTGNTVDPAALAGEFGSDAPRYYFLRAVPFGQDGDYTRASFVARYTSELVNGFGNLVQRVTTLAARLPSEPVEGDVLLTQTTEALRSRYQGAFEALALHDAVRGVNELVTEVNRYLEVNAPWELAKRGDRTGAGVVVGNALNATRIAADLYRPVIPRAAEEALSRLSASPPRIGPPLFRRPDASVD